MTRGTHTVVLTALAAALLACQPATRLAPGVPTKPTAQRATRVADAALAAQLRREGGSRVTAEGASLLGVDAGTVIRLPPSNLVRVAKDSKLIGVDAGTLIGVDAGTLIGVDAGTLIGVDAGTLIGVDAGTLIGRVELPAGLVGGRAYRIASATPTAGVRVYVRDARGRFFVGADGKLVSAVTAADGTVAFPGYRVARGLSLCVPLDAADGVLRALAGLRPRTQPKGVPVGVNQASTLLAGWVESRILVSQPDPAASLDRLTPEAAGQAEAAARTAVSAEALAGSAWRPDQLAEAADTAGTTSQPLAAALQEVRRLMTLAGVDGCEDGKQAREVALRLPIAIAAGATGDIFMASHFTAGLARLAPDGRVYYVLGPCKDQALEVPPFEKLVAGRSGWIWATSNVGRGLFRFRADDPRPVRWAGGGEAAPAVGLPVRECRLGPIKAAAEGADGHVWLVEWLDEPYDRLIEVEPSGSIRAITRTPEDAVAICVTPDGAPWLLGDSGNLLRRGQDGQLRPVLNAALEHVDPRFSNLLAMPDNSVLVSLSKGGNGNWHGVRRVRPDGSPPEVLLGTGQLGFDAEPTRALEASFSKPAGLALDAKGRVFVADYNNGVIRAYDPATGLVEVVAGRRESVEVVAADAVLDLPVAVTYDAEGRAVVSEMGSHSLRRLADGRLTRIAGGLAGRAKEGGAVNRLNGPLMVARSGNGLLLVENNERLVRLLSPGASPDTLTIRTVAGGGTETPRPEGPPVQATSARFSSLTAMTADPMGRPVFAASYTGTDAKFIWRVETDGHLSVLAGARQVTGAADLEREGRQAREVSLGTITGLAFDAAGRLCFSEVDHGLVWRVEQDGTLYRLAGQGMIASFTFLMDAEAEARVRAEGERAGRDAMLLGPTGLAADAQGNVYVAEAGTRGLGLFGEIFDFGAMPLDLTKLAQLDGRLRCLTPEGTARTLAGLGGPPGTEGLRNPISVALSPTGDLAVIDLGSGQLKLIAQR
jgi:sugar lactone lactonase YvrE